MLIAYGSIVGILVFMVLQGVDAKEAYGLVSVPFVALVGGTLTIAKDIL